VRPVDVYVGNVESRQLHCCERCLKRQELKVYVDPHPGAWALGCQVYLFVSYMFCASESESERAEPKFSPCPFSVECSDTCNMKPSTHMHTIETCADCLGSGRRFC
jgi:hypothetical protein